MLILNWRELDILVDFKCKSFTECNIFSEGSKPERDGTQVQGEGKLLVYDEELFFKHLNNIANGI